MSETLGTAGFLDTFRARGAAIADACTRCGDCFRACPMVEPAGLADADPGETTGAIVDLITGGEGSPEAVRWADVCSGSGNCIPACQHGINPRLVVQLARGFARRNPGSPPLPTRWPEPFLHIRRGVSVLSRLQSPPETLARVAASHERPPPPPAARRKHRVERRSALHERPVFPGVVAAVKKLLSIMPGAELVDIDVPRVGTQANSLAQLPKFKRELVQRELQAVSDAGVTTLATIYHACHREICDVGEGRSFEVVNFMELLGEGLGLDSADLYKRLK